MPFLLTALAIERFIRVIKRFRPYFGAIERVIGVLLVATGIVFRNGSITDASSWLLQTFPGLANLAEPQWLRQYPPIDNSGWQNPAEETCDQITEHGEPL